MVCIPCIIAPVLLFIWYRFIQPVVLKFWNPWQSVKNSKSSTTENETNSCPFSDKTSPGVEQTTESSIEVGGKESSRKKSN